MRKLVIMIFLFVIPLSFYAQDRLSGQKGSVVGLKTNIPYWGAMATFNAGIEFRLARHWSLDIETGLNPFDGKKEDGSYGKSLKHWRLHPELRYWFCETSYKHFIGLHVPYILYNVSDIKILGTENERHQGWGAGVGVSYGYSWLLSKHWNLEGNIGVGYARVKYEQFECKTCGEKVSEGHKNYLGPTKAAISLIYLF